MMRLFAVLLAIAGLLLVKDALGWQAWAGVALVWSAAVLYASEPPKHGGQ